MKCLQKSVLFLTTAYFQGKKFIKHLSESLYAIFTTWPGFVSSRDITKKVESRSRIAYMMFY